MFNSSDIIIRFVLFLETVLQHKMRAKSSLSLLWNGGPQRAQAGQHTGGLGVTLLHAMVSQAGSIHAPVARLMLASLPEPVWD